MLRPYFFACTFPRDAHSPAMTDLKRSLRLVDGLAMVVGIMVGSGIFRTPGLVAAQLGRPWLTFVAWVAGGALATKRSEEHTSELQSHSDLVCRLLLEKKKKYTAERF